MPIQSVSATRPSPVRINSLYTYLTKPNRFSWPAPTARNNIDDSSSVASVKHQVTKAADIPTGPLPIVTAIPPLISPATSTMMLIVATAIISFILGALVRTLMGDHEDFFTFLSSGSHTEPDWQEMRRVVEVKLLHWHVVLAIFRGRIQ